MIIISWFFFVRSITLKPGDVILTGTPSGVGMHRKPAEFLKVGDIIESEIQQIGKIKNKVIADFDWEKQSTIEITNKVQLLLK